MRLQVYTSALFAATCGAQAVSSSSGSNPPIRNVYTFPNNTFIENIAVRSNSRLVVTSMSVPDLFTINPKAATPQASVIHTFTNASGLSGVTEVAPDVFAVVSGTWDLAATRAQLGSLAVWTVNLNTPSPVVTLVAQILNSTIFNGIVRHPTNPRLLLAADSALGAVWRVDLLTGAYGVAFSNPLLQPTGTAPGTNLGINGIKAAGNHVYFTNSAQHIFAKVAIDSNANPTGSIQIISNSTNAGSDVVYDDFALSNQGSGPTWIASHPDYVVRVSPGGSQTVINDTIKLLNPTSAALGRGDFAQQKTLYVTNGGQFAPNFDLINEGVVAVDISHF